MFRGGFFPLLLTFFIVAAIFVSTLNATGLSHQELSAAPREKRSNGRYPCKCIPGTGCTGWCTETGVGLYINPTPEECGYLSGKDKEVLKQKEPESCPEPETTTAGVEKIGYGIGLMVAALFAYLFLH